MESQGLPLTEHSAVFQECVFWRGYARRVFPLLLGLDKLSSQNLGRKEK
jgi:hypothetical protein